MMMRMVSGVAFAFTLALGTVAHAADLDWGKLLNQPLLNARSGAMAAFLKLKEKPQLAAALKAPWVDAFHAFLKAEKGSHNLDFLNLSSMKDGLDKRTLFNRFVKDGAANALKLSDEVRAPLLAIAKKAQPAKGKATSDIWDKLDFAKAQEAVRARLAEKHLKPFVGAVTAAKKALDKTIAAGQWYNKIRLEKGDIILYVDRGYATGVSVSQGAMRLLIPTSNFGSYKGSIYTHHAAVVAEAKSGLGVAHSVGDGGVSFKAIDDLNETGIRGNTKVYGSYMVFRLKDAALRKKVAKEVSAVATNWTGAQSKFTGYSDWTKLAKAGFASSSYGPHAITRAKAFYEARDKGGLAETAFCSQLVIAIYQAAIGVKDALKIMALDADYTSPMKLHHYLADNSKVWTFVGVEKYPQ